MNDDELEKKLTKIVEECYCAYDDASIAVEYMVSGLIKNGVTLCTASTEPRNVPQASVEPNGQETCAHGAIIEPKWLCDTAETILHNNPDLFSVWVKDGDQEVKLERISVGERIGTKSEIGFGKGKA